MVLGALLVVAALLLTAWNLLEERQAGDGADDVLHALLEGIPTVEEPEEISLAVTDSKGRAVDWPMDETGAPMAWPLDESGQPVAEMADASGRMLSWPTDEDDRPLPWTSDWWTVTAAGLLPWVTGSDGVTAQWPVNLEGLLCGLNEIRESWTLLVSKMSDSLKHDAPDFVQNPQKEMPTSMVKGDDYIGVVEVPSLGLSLPVMSSWSYPKLRKAPCRFEGSAYSGDLIIAGHNYTRHFGRLKNLSAGTEVRFTDVAGNVFVYKVLTIEKLGSYDSDAMRSGEWDLTLFTCTYGGGSRVTVRCGLTSVNAAS